MRPPKWIDHLLDYLLEPRLYEAAVGDLDEKYQRRLAANTPRWKAKLYYIVEGISFVRLAKASALIPDTNHTMMFRNYMIVALRNFSKDKLYVFLNLAGLCIGITCAIVIYTYIVFEKSYDRFHKNADSIYRITEQLPDDAQLVNSAMNHSPMAPILASNLPGVKNVVRILPYSSFYNCFVSVGPDRIFKENRFGFVDSTFFDTFTFPPLAGSLEHALDAPFDIVITRSMAIKYFDQPERAVGKTIIFENDSRKFDFHVTAVIHDFPQNSHFSLDFMASISSLEQFMPWYDNWHYPPLYLYMEMMTPVDKLELQKSIHSIASRSQPAEVVAEKRSYAVQPLTEIHLHSRLEYEWEANSNYQYIRIYILAGIFLLIVACINFMNMSTAKSVRRAREVGMRKVLGGRKSQLIGQFLSESFLYCLISFITGVLIAELSLRIVLTEIIGKELSLVDLVNPETAVTAGVFLMALSLIAGFYPAFYLSAFNPSHTLKGKLSRDRSASLRKGLVTFQFLISCFLITGTYIVMRQVDFMIEKDLGFKESHMIVLRLSDRDAQMNYAVLKNDLLQESVVSQAGLSSTIPGGGNFYGIDAVAEGSPDQKPVNIKSLGVDEGFIPAYDLKLVDGRNFSTDVPTDQAEAFILNETAVKRFGWTDAIGKGFQITVYINGAVVRKGKVIGVVKDFHFQSLHNNIEPLVLYINKHPYYADYLSVAFNAGSPSASVELLRKKWAAFNPDKPLDFLFLDSSLNDLYTTEIKISKIFNILAILSIFISCLGLFGLSAFMAERRSKEVGIRKVFGARLVHIANLQNREFLPLIIGANVIVWPVAYLWAQKWLQGFAYHIELTPMIFLLILLGSVAIVVVTLAYFSLRMATKNPVQTLRYE